VGHRKAVRGRVRGGVGRWGNGARAGNGEEINGNKVNYNQVAVGVGVGGEGMERGEPVKRTLYGQQQ
jgi:hypothetical protein